MWPLAGAERARSTSRPYIPDMRGGASRRIGRGHLQGCLKANGIGRHTVSVVGRFLEQPAAPQVPPPPRSVQASAQSITGAWRTQASSVATSLRSIGRRPPFRRSPPRDGTRPVDFAPRHGGIGQRHGRGRARPRSGIARPWWRSSARRHLPCPARVRLTWGRPPAWCRRRRRHRLPATGTGSSCPAAAAACRCRPIAAASARAPRHPRPRRQRCHWRGHRCAALRLPCAYGTCVAASSTPSACGRAGAVVGWGGRRRRGQPRPATRARPRRDSGRPPRETRPLPRGRLPRSCPDLRRLHLLGRIREEVGEAVARCPPGAMAAVYEEIGVTGRGYISQREFRTACASLRISPESGPRTPRAVRLAAAGPVLFPPALGYTAGGNRRLGTPSVASSRAQPQPCRPLPARENSALAGHVDGSSEVPEWPGQHPSSPSEARRVHGRPESLACGSMCASR